MFHLEKIQLEDTEKIKELSALAGSIVKEHYDPIIGPAQNDYMIEMFQSVEALKRQLREEHTFYMAVGENENVGYLACYPKEGKLYLDKFYLKKEVRGKGYGRKMMEFVMELGKSGGYPALFLNVNKHNEESIALYQHMGFTLLRKEKNPIGEGFYMDDFVFEHTL